MSIDKQKLLEHMNKKVLAFRREYGATEDQLRCEKIWGEMKILEWYIEQIESGTFDIKEEIPIFQLKDRVYHKDFKAKGTIIKIAKSGKRAYVRWDDGSPASYVLLDKLVKEESPI